jgi:hypothetical protein
METHNVFHQTLRYHTPYQFLDLAPFLLTTTLGPKETKDMEMQPIFYNDRIQNWGSKHTWMGFVDTDEFFDTPGPESLPEILKSYEANASVGALGVNWRTHTSNGLLKRPLSNRKSFTTCIIDEVAPNGVVSDNLHVKSIVKTSAYINPESPHTFHLKDSAITVGEHGDEVWDQPRQLRETGSGYIIVVLRAGRNIRRRFFGVMRIRIRRVGRGGIILRMRCRMSSVWR